MSSSSREEKEGSSPPVSVNQLKPGMENVTVRVRVLEVGKPKKIETKKGTRTITSAVVGDGTGRVEAVLWGAKVAALKAGDVIEISHAWVTEFRGKVQLNIGKSTEIKPLPSDSVPEEIPEQGPAARSTPTRRPPRRRPAQSRRGGEEVEQ